MSDDAFTPTFGNRRGLEPIDTDRLLASIPDSTSDGISREDLRRSYSEGQPPFHPGDFDAALDKLAEAGLVRTTTRRIWGTPVPLYRRAA